MTFKIAPKKVDSIDVVEIHCPVCSEEEERLEPDGLKWRCLTCGMEFEEEISH